LNFSKLIFIINSVRCDTFFCKQEGYFIELGFKMLLLFFKPRREFCALEVVSCLIYSGIKKCNGLQDWMTIWSIDN